LSPVQGTKGNDVNKKSKNIENHVEKTPDSSSCVWTSLKHLVNKLTYMGLNVQIQGVRTPNECEKWRKKCMYI